MKFKWSLISIFAGLVLIFAGCSQGATSAPSDTQNTGQQTQTTQTETASPAEETATAADNIGEWSITVEVAGEDPIEFTNEDAQKIGPVEITAAVKDGDSLGESHTYTGIRLYDFLDYIGINDFSVIGIEGAGGASQELDPSRIDEQGTGFAWAEDGEMLDATTGPVELVNHNRGPKWWIKQVSRITVVK